MRKRALSRCLAALAVLAATLIPASPAHASRDTERPRSGASTWVPRHVSFQSTQLSAERARLLFQFQWDGSTQRQEMEGDYHTFELNVDIPCDWALEEYDSTTQGYDAQYFFTNIPASARPFEDTIFGDGCSGADGVVRYGIGVLKAEDLTSGTLYWAEVGIRTDAGSNWDPSALKLVAQTGTKYDADIVGNVYDNEDCSFNSTELSTWTNNTQAAMDKRLQASWCAWPDFTHTVVRDESGILMTGEYEAFDTNKLANYSLDSSGTPAANWSSSTGGATRYCNDPYPAFQGSCFVQVTGVLWQEVAGSVQTVTAGHVTAEAALRCRTGTSCPVYVQVGGIDTTPNPDVGEDWVGDTVTVPNDGHWYICRVDYDHSEWNNGDQNNDHNSNDYPQMPASTIDKWRLDILPSPGSGATVDVDFAFLGGKTSYYDANDGPPILGDDVDGEIADVDRPQCTQQGV